MIIGGIVLFQQQYQSFWLVMGFSSESLVLTWELVVVAMQNSWSVLTIILHISKEMWSSARAHSCSILTLLWSCLHMAWQLLLILFSWASDQRLLLGLQEAYVLFWYFLQAVCIVTSSVSEHMMQSLEAASISELATFSLDKPESDEAWYPGFLDLSATVPSSGSVMALDGLEWGLVGSCPCCSKLGSASGTNSGVSCHPVQSSVHSWPQPLGSWHRSSCLDDSWVICRKSSPTYSMWCQQWTLQMGAPLGECQQKVYMVRDALEEAEFQFDELDCLRGQALVSSLSLVQCW